MDKQKVKENLKGLATLLLFGFIIASLSVTILNAQMISINNCNNLCMNGFPNNSFEFNNCVKSNCSLRGM